MASLMEYAPALLLLVMLAGVVVPIVLAIVGIHQMASVGFVAGCLWVVIILMLASLAARSAGLTT